MTGSSASLAARLDDAGVEAVSFDLFGTLLSVEKPPDPSRAVAEALAARGISLPQDWETAYRTAYIETDHPLQEVPLGDHVLSLLEAHAGSAGSGPDPAAVNEAVREAFDTDIQTRERAAETVEAFAEHVPVGILSNSSVPGLVDRSLEQSDIPLADLTVVHSSVAVGWRKPHERAFAAVAEGLEVRLDSLVHVGDDSRTDGGAERAGAHSVIVPESGPLNTDVILEAEGWPR